jgi:hypothetical protein
LPDFWRGVWREFGMGILASPEIRNAVNEIVAQAK